MQKRFRIGLLARERVSRNDRIEILREADFPEQRERETCGFIRDARERKALLAQLVEPVANTRIHSRVAAVFSDVVPLEAFKRLLQKRLRHDAADCVDERALHESMQPLPDECSQPGDSE